MWGGVSGLETGEALTATFVKYVKHDDIAAHEARGWVVSSKPEDMRHHNVHGVIMEFTDDRFPLPWPGR